MRRPMPVLELVFEDHAGVKHESNKFKQGDPVNWNLDTSVLLAVSESLFSAND
jgi:hypothetical protein